MLADSKGAISLAEVELGAEGGLVGDQFPVAVDLACVFDAKLERFLVSDKDVSDVHLGDGKLGLGSLALTGEVKGEALLVARHIGEGRAGVVVRALGSEGHTAGHLCVGPDFALQRLDLEDLILEEHLVFVDGVADGHVLAVQGRYCPLLASLHLGLLFGFVVGVITVELAVFFVVFTGLNGLLDLVSLFLLLLG